MTIGMVGREGRDETHHKVEKTKKKKSGERLATGLQAWRGIKRRSPHKNASSEGRPRQPETPRSGASDAFQNNEHKAQVLT